MIGPLTPMRPEVRAAPPPPPGVIACIGLRDPAELPAALDSPWLRLRGVPKSEGEVILVPADPPVFLASLGPAGAADRPAATRLGAAMAAACAGMSEVALDLTTFAGVDLQGLFEGLFLASYRFDRYRSQQRTPKLAVVHICGGDPGAVSAALSRARTVARGVCAARDLVQVSYRGGAPAIADLVAGVVQASVSDYASAAPAIQGGRVRAVGIPAPQRLDLLPDVPTLAEQGITGADVYSWQGVVVPTGTPDAIVVRLQAELERALRNPEIAQRLRSVSLEPFPGSSEQLRDLIASETAIWGPLIRELGITLDS